MAENEAQQQRSLEIVSRIATDICCSVSDQLHWHTVPTSKQTRVPPVSAVFLLLFPLTVAAAGMGVSDELHNWAITRLSIIGNTMGVQQALSLIPIAKRQRQQWKAGRMDYLTSSHDTSIRGGK